MQSHLMHGWDFVKGARLSLATKQKLFHHFLLLQDTNLFTQGVFFRGSHRSFNTAIKKRGSPLCVNDAIHFCVSRDASQLHVWEGNLTTAVVSKLPPLSVNDSINEHWIIDSTYQTARWKPSCVNRPLVTLITSAVYPFRKYSRSVTSSCFQAESNING